MRRIFLAACALTAYAACPDGTRPTTEAERAFYSKTMRAIRAAMPPAPPGWIIEDHNRLDLGPIACKDKDFSRLAYAVTYSYVERIQASKARGEEIRNQVAEMRKLPADKAAQQAELARQKRELERRKSESGADAAALDAQIRELEQRSLAIRKEHEASVQPKILAIAKAQLEAEKGVNNYVSIILEVNEPHPAGAALSVGKPAGKRTLRLGSLALYAKGEPALVDKIVKLWDLETVRKGD